MYHIVLECLLILRKSDFDDDYATFTHAIQDLDHSIQVFIENSFNRPLKSVQAIQLLQRFEAFKIPSMQVYFLMFCI